MCRFFVTTLLFFVTFITEFEVRAENVTKIVEVINGFEFGYGTDAASGALYLVQTCGPHDNFSKNNIDFGATDGQGTTANVVFTLNGPAFSDSNRYLLSEFSVVRCRAYFTKGGYLPIYKDFPPLVSWRYVNISSSSYLKCYAKATIEFPNWDNPDDPFGDGGGGGDDEEDDEDEVCCEHHAAIQGATERSADAAESIDGKLGGIEDDLSSIDDKLTFVNPGDTSSVSIPSFGVPGIGVPLPTVPDVSVPSLSLPEVGGVFYVGEVRKEDRAFAVLRLPPVTKTEFLQAVKDSCSVEGAVRAY